jgi:hypothetical protein
MHADRPLKWWEWIAGAVALAALVGGFILSLDVPVY